MAPGAPNGAQPSAEPSSPGELRLAAAQLPQLGEVPRSPAIASTTPGLSGAVLRAPTAPTGPDFDPVSLTSLIARMANEVYALPPGPAGNLPGTMDVTTLDGGAPHGGSPAPLNAEPAPSGGAAPFASASAPSEAPATPAAHAPEPPRVSGTRAPYDPSSANTYSPTLAAASPHAPVDPGVPTSGKPSAPPAGSAVPSSAVDTTPTTHHAHRDDAGPRAPTPATGGVPSMGTPFDVPLDFSGFEAAPQGSALDLDGLRFPLFDPPHETAEAREAPEAFRAPEASRPLAIPHYELAPTEQSKHVPGAPLDAHSLKKQFPILSERVNGKPLVWLDNGATTQKPKTVIDRISYFYEHENSNIHRAAHTLAGRATDAYEKARESVRRFLNAPSAKDIVFVRGTTEGINFVAQSWGRRNVREGDEIVITHLEHHANIVPWQMLAAEKGAKIRVAPVDSRGQIILEEYEKLLNPKTKLVSMTHVSNALGTITPAREMIAMAHRYGARVLLDGAQSVSHMPVDLQALDCDFFVFSGHKVFAPTGIGAVFGKSDVLEHTPPWQGGGNMIQDVTFEHTVYQGVPARFEAGTGNIADAVGLGAALDWLRELGIERVERYEHELLEYATPRLQAVPGLTLVGTAKEKAGVLGFVLEGQKTEEVGGKLDQEGIAVRSGHHCAQPILRRFGYEATVRASLAPYNTHEDIDTLVAALHRLQSGRPTR